MADGWRIRRARDTEADTLLALWERSVRATHDFLTDADVHDLSPRVREYLDSDAPELWVLAGRVDAPEGFMGLEGAEVAALFLEPASQGKGGGRALVEHAQALRGGALTVDVNEQNGAARGFYEALGFAVVGRSPFDGEGRPFPLLHLRRPAGA